MFIQSKHLNYSLCTNEMFVNLESKRETIKMS